MNRQQWRWAPERLVEQIRLRLSRPDRLRLLEVAERLGVAETTVARRALLTGLSIVETSEELK